MRDFGRGFARIYETLGENLQKFVSLRDRIRDFARIHEDLQDFGRGFARILRLWERICKDL